MLKKSFGNSMVANSELCCPCCGVNILPCPFCGKEGKIYGSNMVGCSDLNCGGNVDFGHFDGEQDGIPAVHWVIEQWNKRTPNSK